MVFLTTRLWLRNRITDRFWRVQEVLKHARVSARAGIPWGHGQAGACASIRTPFLSPRPAFQGKEESLLSAGRQGGDQSLR